MKNYHAKRANDISTTFYFCKLRELFTIASGQLWFTIWLFILNISASAKSKSYIIGNFNISYIFIWRQGRAPIVFHAEYVMHMQQWTF